MINHALLDGLFAPFWVECVLDGVCSLDEVVDIDSRALAENAPDQTRSVEEERLDKQHHRHPLVVADVVLDGARLHADWTTLWYVVRVCYPAYLHSVRTSYCCQSRLISK